MNWFNLIPTDSFGPGVEVLSDEEVVLYKVGYERP